MSVLLLLAVFPSQRFVNLPTGVLPETGVWQVCISHRFYPSVTAPNWTHNPLQAFLTPDVWLTLDRSISERWLAGGGLGIISHRLAVRAAWAPIKWLTLYPELDARLYDFQPDSAWFDVGLSFHQTLGRGFAFAVQPRYTAGTEHQYLSLGLAAAVGLGRDYAVALEAEPVLLGRDSTTRQLAAGIAIQKQVGWHDFAITLGTALNQYAPAMLRSMGESTPYSDVLDLGKGRMRIGFNLFRKI
jgi:hypothetical protein